MVKFSNLFSYINNGGFCFFLIVISFLFGKSFVAVLVKILFGIWVDDSWKKDHNYYFMTLIMLVGIIAVLIIFGAFCFAYFITRTCYETYKQFIYNIFKKKLSFFDLNPIGKLIALSSRDASIMDFSLP